MMAQDPTGGHIFCRRHRHRLKQTNDYSLKKILASATWRPVWPDLAKFRRFNKNVEIFGNILKVNSTPLGPTL